MGLKPEEFLKHEFAPGFPVNRNMCEAVQVALDYVEALQLQYLDLVVQSEQRVEIGAAIGLEKGVYAGTADITAYSLKAGKLFGIDYKHGMGVVVDVEDNEQLLSYAAGVYQTDPRFVGLDMNLVVIQPRARSGLQIKEITYTYTYVMDWLHSIHGVARKALSGKEPRVPGDHCQFCKAAGSCGERAAYILDKGFNDALIDFSALLEPIETPPKEIVKELPRIGNMTNEQLSKVLGQGAVLAKWFNDVMEEGKRRLEEGQTIEGWELKEGRKTREWADETIAAQKLKELYNLEDSELYKTQMLSAPGVESLLKDKKLFKSKDKLEAAQPSLVNIKPGNKVMKQVNAIDDFDDIV